MRTAEMKPLFTYSATWLVSLQLLVAAAAIGLFGLHSLYVYPTDVASVVFWFGVGILAAYLGLRQWRGGVRSASFYEDRIDIVTRELRRDVNYSEVESLTSFQGSVVLTFKDRKISALRLRNSNIQTLKMDKKDWLVTKVPAETLRFEPIKIGFSSVIRKNSLVLLGKGARWILLLLIAQAILSIIIPSIAFLPGEQSYFMVVDQQSKTTFAGLTHFEEFVAFFKNNVVLAMSNLVPGIGVLSFLSTTYDTARIAQVNAMTRGQLSPSLYTGYFFLFPHTWIELSGYAIAIFEAFQIADMFRKMRGRPGFAKFIVAHIIASVFVVTLVILVAAAFEEGEIVMGSLGLLAWIPFGLIVLTLFMVRHRQISGQTEPPL
jgi:hypothetical protein